ncbi:hypothetical protein CBP51_08795 [Cellvibrio mixtus]|uniref:Uncharacterized protein n=1 Tax=Cellvibrio mixtus TaxID=39650 RepID=A0A266QBQ7_9GAMM|nr:hypothetical protein [Cellvibrio mixtus]OZY87066.1 hypothetical protein CBP51_08795 [Cellvibrio mixtus]
MVRIVDLKGNWAAAIGKAFVAFGSIEHITVACLREIPSDKIPRTAKSFKLGQRIEFLLELLESHSEASFANLSEKLKEVKELSKMRNLIAHNPLLFEVYKFDNGSLFHREVIAALHSEKRITLSEVEKFASNAETLASELLNASLKAFEDMENKRKA